jgi:hypothetical protein
MISPTKIIGETAMGPFYNPDKTLKADAIAPLFRCSSGLSLVPPPI